MSNVVLFFLTRTQAAALKGGNVSFELAGERWLTLMQEQKWEGGWEKRKRLERKAERERCAVKTEGKKKGGKRAEQRRRGIRRKNIRAQAGGEQERRAAGVRLNILSVWFPTGGCWINRTVCDNVLLHSRHLLPLPCSNQPPLVNTPAAGPSSLRSDRASRNCGNTQRTWRAEEVPGRRLTA